MPRKDIWIRKEDEKVWDDIEDKPQFIHVSLMNWVTIKEQLGEPMTTAEEVMAEDTARKATQFFQAKEEGKLPTSKTFEFCKHDQVKGLCKQGCKA